MNKPTHYVLVGALILFIGLYIPFYFAGEKADDTHFTQATDIFTRTNTTSRNHAFTSVSTNLFQQKKWSARLYTAGRDTYASETSASMTMPLEFNTFQWKPSAGNPFIEERLAVNFVANNHQQHAIFHHAHPVVHRNTSTNSQTIAHNAANEYAALKAPQYVSHRSTVYQPFSNTLPSESNTSFAGDAPKGITGRKNGFITPSDPGDRSEESPVGEPWIMLIFAAAAALTITLRKRLQKAQA